MILNDIERAVICGKQEYRTNADFIDAIEAAVIAKLCAGVEMPEPISYVSFNRQGDISRIIKRKDSWTNTPVFTADQLRTCIAAARVKAYAAAGASPVEPNFCESCAMDLSTCDCVTPRPVFVNQLPSAQPPAPGEAAREYMTGYSDGREWAAAPQPKETK